MEAKNSRLAILIACDNDALFAELSAVAHQVSQTLRIYQATNRKKIDDLVKQNFFDVIIVDGAIQLGSGIKLIAQLEKSGILIPIIYFSDKKSSENFASALDAGATDVLYSEILEPKVFEYLLLSVHSKWEKIQKRTVEILKYQLLSQGTQEGLVLTDGLRIIEANDTFARMFGYTLNDLSGKVLAHLVEISWTNPQEEKEYQKANGWKRDRSQLSLLYRRIECHYQGQKLFLLSVRIPRATDITQAGNRRRANYFKALVDTSIDFISVFTPKGRIKYVTPSIQQNLGYTVEEAIRLNPYELIHPDDLPHFISQLSLEGWKTGSSKVLEIRVKHHEGDWRFLECMVRNQLHDPAIRGIVANCRDITLRQLEEGNPLNSRARLELITRVTNDGIWDWNIRDNLLFWSNRLYELLGLDAGTPIQKWEDVYKLVHTSDQQTLRDSLENHLTKNAPFQVEIRLICNDGKYGYFVVRGESIRNENREAVYMAGSITDITARKNAENLVKYESLYDKLTALPKRELLYDRIQSNILRSQKNLFFQFAVLWIDLDRFSNIINSFGHQPADKLLVEFTYRIKRALGADGTISRIGGDEFGILLEDCHVNKALRISQQIQKSLMSPFTIMQKDVYLTASIGIAMNSPVYDNADEMMRDAGVAMNRAKKKEKGGAEVFNSVMHYGAVRRLQLETDLRKALDHDQFEIYYQPIVSLGSGKVSSLESLIRWNHPDKGLLMPADFIPLAEETGLILSIDEWVLNNACRQVKDWTSHGIPVPRVAINFSAKQFRNKDMADMVQNALHQYRVPPGTLEIEITETTVMEDNESNFETLQKLSQLGVHFSIDDFGTGYSSLGYLRKFPSHTIKIDGSFIQGLEKGKEDSAIVSAIIALAKNLNLHLVAEGVESNYQLSFLKQKQCDDVQGFGIARPMSLAKIQEYLTQGISKKDIHL